MSTWESWSSTSWSLGASLSGPIEAGAEIEQVIEEFIIHFVAASCAIKNAVNGVKGISPEVNMKGTLPLRMRAGDRGAIGVMRAWG